jgi:hypothetical protein
VRRLLAGGVPGPGVVLEDLWKSYEPSQPYEIAKNGEKTGRFTHVLAYKSPKTPFFALKYLTRYTHEMFFEEYINIKNFRNLSHCGVIPVQSFGSHIRPQPHGLGLNVLKIFLSGVLKRVIMMARIWINILYIIQYLTVILAS